MTDHNSSEFGPGCLKRMITRARRGTGLKESRRVIDCTTHELKFYKILLTSLISSS